MTYPNAKSQGTQPPPAVSSRGHPMPRRASPEQSITLRHHRLAHDASMRAGPRSNDNASSPRRNSSGESYDTGTSDPKRWFDRSNRNPPAAFDHTSMDGMSFTRPCVRFAHTNQIPVDPPFFQKQSDSSNEDVSHARAALPFAASAYQHMKPAMAAQSSSADDYRSVIDDLTVENKRLKEELKRYKQFGPDLLRKDKLFEIKVHGLPKKKKRELEATLRDFASSLEGSVTSSNQLKNPPKSVGRLPGSSHNSKHASSSSSHSRPVDSAYASMSTGPSSVGPSVSMGRPSLGRGRSSTEQKVESYLDDIPQGLFPRQVAMTDKEKKKLVVRRLEQLFTGKMMNRGRGSRSIRLPPALEPQVGAGGLISAPPQLSAAPGFEPSREARIQFESAKKARSREDLSASNSNGEVENTCTQTGSGSTSNEHIGQGTSPQDADLPEQRATRPVDLDPDRIQNPSENMQYIRHLGVTAPKYVTETKYMPRDVSMDADGWIHLNLLCNLAQLHILNVTPDYIRSAVTERSTKFQLSRDGRKIRWRGGTEGTKFSSDSSGDSSQRSPDTEGTDGSNEDGQRKKQKTNGRISAHPSKGQAKFGPQQASAPSEGFHYKPMFVHNHSSSLETSMDDTISQASGPVEQSNLNSRSTGFVSGSGSPPRRKRRRDGAIVYYTGAPFCLDLSGDPCGDLSPITYMTSTGQEPSPSKDGSAKPELIRSASGSSLPYRPLEDGPDSTEDEETEFVGEDTDMSDDDDVTFPWCGSPNKPTLKPLEARLEPCGLGGVTSEDHFAILVVTRHPIGVRVTGRPGVFRLKSDETTDSIASRIAGLSTNSPRPAGHPFSGPHIQVEVIQERYKELKPLPLPPPAIFYPPFTETTESDDYGFEDDYAEDDDESDIVMESDEGISKRATRESENGMGDSEQDSIEDEDEIVSDEIDLRPSVSFAPISQRVPSSVSKLVDRQPDSSGATAGGEASGYSSSREESGESA